MDQIEVTIPSKMISFGNVRPFIQVEDASNLAEVALAYLTAVMEYQQHEENIVKAKQAAKQAEHDDFMKDVPEDHEAAAILAEGLGGVTVVEDVKAPWEETPKAEPTPNAWDSEPDFGGFDWG